MLHNRVPLGLNIDEQLPVLVIYKYSYVLSDQTVRSVDKLKTITIIVKT